MALLDEESVAFREVEDIEKKGDDKQHKYCWYKMSRIQKCLILFVLLSIVVVIIALCSLGLWALIAYFESNPADIPTNVEDIRLHSPLQNKTSKESLAVEIQREKVENLRKDFAERFPRRALEVPNSIPLPLSYYRRGNLTTEDKIDEIFQSFDGDANNEANPWELHDWILWVDKIVYNNNLEREWSFFRKQDHQLSWADYLYQLNPSGARHQYSHTDFRKKQRRWNAADQNGDNWLTKEEFKIFLFPHLNTEMEGLSVLVHEAFEDLDGDDNGQVTKNEFLLIHHPNETQRMSDYFDNILDKDANGYVSLDEISIWVEPTGFVPAKSEVVYLMEKLDDNRNKQLSRDEVLHHPHIFINSQVTFFNDIYRSESLRSQVFRHQF